MEYAPLALDVAKKRRKLVTSPLLQQVWRHRIYHLRIMEKNPNERPETDIIRLPLTHHELLVLMRCLVIASESDRIEDADKQKVGDIKDRVVRFSERQGAWWDLP
jgi:hypothetical protein